MSLPPCLSFLRVNKANFPLSDSVVTHIITLLESVNTTACINKLLLAGKERMAL